MEGLGTGDGQHPERDILGLMMGEAKRRRLAAQAAGIPLEAKTAKLPRSVARLLPSAFADSIGAPPLPPGLVPTTPKEPLSEQVRGLCAGGDMPP